MTARTRRSLPSTAAADPYSPPLPVRPSAVPRVPGGLGAATLAAVERVRANVDAFVALDEDFVAGDEAAMLLSSLDDLEREVTRLVAAAGHTAERVRRREYPEETAARSEALWALRRGGVRQDPTASSS